MAVTRVWIDSNIAVVTTDPTVVVTRMVHQPGASTICDFCGGGDPICPVCAFPCDPDPYGMSAKNETAG